MGRKKSRKVTIRALIILVIFLLGVSGMFSRFVYIQASKEVQGHNLQELLERRWTTSVTLDGKRGTIFDRNGESLAEEIPSYTVIAILDERFDNRVKDPVETARQLSSVLEIDAETIEGFLTRGIDDGRVQVELGPRAKYLSFEKKEEVMALELSGIQMRADPRRFYPKQTFASHILGYTERDMSTARMGLEYRLDEYLKEEDGRISYQKDGKNRRLTNANEVIDPPKNGDDVYLTLDTRIQMTIEQTMNQVEAEFSPERMMTIVANAKTGEILGMSNRPTFNPNQYESIENYTNFNVQSRFEPGSTMKIFTLAAAIEEGVYNGEEFYQSGSIQVGPDTIRDHNRYGWGQITFDEGFQRSSNVAFSILALERLGSDRLYHYVDAFGFTNPTGIDLPNEANALIAKGARSDVATTAFGQGTAVTPIQIVQGATAIANGGKMMKPFIIDRIVDGNSNEIVMENIPEVVGEPISEETSKEVLRLMESVVSAEVGTGRPFAIDGFQVAGKTGTAQIVGDNRRYMTGHGNSIFSFIGMAPAEDPEIIVYVAIDRPKLAEYEVGSTPVAMIFKSVMKQSLQYFNISPTEGSRDREDNEIILDDYTGYSVSETTAFLKQNGMDVIVIGDGNLVETQYPTSEIAIIPGERVLLKTDGDQMQIPDLSNWSLRHIYAFQELIGIPVDVTGHGFVHEQMPAPLMEISNVERIKVSLYLPGDAPIEEVVNEWEEDLESEDGEEESFFMD
ncbi:penicillin-binding transpeptidase domain-containing protein [Evansella tamaricis]|uniref:Penicillin-binding protein n=1 Tax=Evansella tamaricis TaxID=2069301 RepID=A0ABS6JFK0_9BACI|nr:penicillin-binding transpeptidase domain-containing protein [Evansella tamaricis]MBU9712416.1 penicillin-binding protein [Evansella tamaricis]